MQSGHPASFESHHSGRLNVRRQQRRGNVPRRELNLVRGSLIALGQWAGLDRSASLPSLLQFRNDVFVGGRYPSVGML